MASLKKIHNQSSSLSRSPTIQYRIDSLSRLEEGLGDDKILELEPTPTSFGLVQMHIEEPHSFGKYQRGDYRKSHDQHYYKYRDYWKPHSPRFSLRSLHTRGSKLRFILPLVVVVTFPCFYYYTHILSEPRNTLPLSLDKDNFDHIALVFFFSAVLVSIKVACPHLNVICRIRAVFTQGRGCFALMHLKPVFDFLNARKRGKKLLARASFVTWTIGSKEKSERSICAREGVQMYSNGDVYEGEFHQGRYSGSGVYHFYMSGRYEGDWVDGKYDGFGVETWTRGSRYRGQYRRVLREGCGLYRFYTGDVYSGEWLNGQSHGCGVQTCEDGSRFVGEFKWGVKHGFGYYRFRNGDTYAGEYFTDKMHGYGVYQFANGHRYEGAWHEGKRQGLGIYAFRSGDIQAGYWHAGMLQTRSTHNPVMGVTVAISHSKVLHAVQEARRASAKSHNLSHVDERVNKAVAAANPAANAARMAAVKVVQSRALNSFPP
ncbi:hypothetical protein L7F22_045398 [Adiantum nelumboides]|nr:hypothetical protein [Adiantum nelumboides]